METKSTTLTVDCTSEIMINDVKHGGVAGKTSAGSGQLENAPSFTHILSGVSATITVEVKAEEKVEVKAEAEAEVTRIKGNLTGTVQSANSTISRAVTSA